MDKYKCDFFANLISIILIVKKDYAIKNFIDKKWVFLSSLSAIKITICCVIAARITSTLREIVFLNFV